MRCTQGNRTRPGGVTIALALAAAALLALPAIGLSKDGDGDRGPRAAGKIESFDRESGELVVDLAKGGTISGLVVRRTRIRCGEGRRRHRRPAAASRTSADRLGERAPESEPTDVGDAAEEAPDDDSVASDDTADDAQGRDRRRRRDRCNRRDLVPGAIVIRAEIVLTHGAAFYKTVGLLPPRAERDAGSDEE